MRILTKVLVLASALALSSGAEAQTLQQNNEAMFREMQQARGLSNGEMQKIRQIFAGSSVIGQGNPAVTRRPLTREQLTAKLGKDPKSFYRNSQFERICGEKWMAPLYDPAT
ncbi:MAG: hypothetical protein AAGB07_19290, partial [Pseudomonadota bacterium]